MSRKYPFNGYEAMASGYTNGLYLPSKPLEEWNIDECRRALCRQANGDVMRCLECENKCRYGRRIETLLTPPENAEEKPAKKDMQKAWKNSAETRKRKTDIKYLQAIASGDPAEYLKSHGMEIRNNLYRLRRRFENTTAEEARKRLAEMGAEVEENSPQPTRQPEEEQKAVSTEDEQVEENKIAPVGFKGVKLQIHTVSGKYFRYTRMTGNEGISIEPNSACIATCDNVDAVCAEVRAAFEMLA